MKYSKEELLEEAKKFLHRIDWKKGSPKTYAVAVNRKIVNECCEHMTSKRNINGVESIKKRAYGLHRRNAKDRGIVSYLSYEDYIKIVLKPCAYCGEFSTRKNTQTKHTTFLNSCDRVNNEMFYKIENTQSLCFTCQKMKMAMTHKEFLEHLNKIKSHKDEEFL